MAFGRLITVVGVCLLAAAGLCGWVERERMKGATTVRATTSSAAKRVAATSARRGLNVRVFTGDIAIEYISFFLLKKFFQVSVLHPRTMSHHHPGARAGAAGRDGDGKSIALLYAVRRSQATCCCSIRLKKTLLSSAARKTSSRTSSASS